MIKEKKAEKQKKGVRSEKGEKIGRVWKRRRRQEGRKEGTGGGGRKAGRREWSLPLLGKVGRTVGFLLLFLFPFIALKNELDCFCEFF